MSSAIKELETKVAAARVAAKKLARLSSEVKNKALLNIAENLALRRNEIMAENQRDRAAADEANMSAAMQDRLMLNTSRIAGIATDVQGRGRAARSGRRGLRYAHHAQRAPDQPQARAAGGHRHHLREPAQRHGGHLHPLSEVGQRGDPARRQRGHPLQPGPGQCRAEVGLRSRRPRGRHPDHRVHRPGGGGPHAEDERPDRPHRAPGRGGADQVRGRPRHHAGAGGRGRGLPHLRRQERQAQ